MSTQRETVDQNNAIPDTDIDSESVAADLAPGLDDADTPSPVVMSDLDDAATVVLDSRPGKQIRETRMEAAASAGSRRSASRWLEYTASEEMVYRGRTMSRLEAGILRLWHWVFYGSATHSIRALNLIFAYLDGLPTQRIEAGMDEDTAARFAALAEALRNGGPIPEPPPMPDAIDADFSDIDPT